MSGKGEQPQREQSLQEAVERLQRQILRLQADFANYRRRSAKHFAEMDKSARAKVIAAVLPLIDSIERAAESVPEEQREVRQGLEMLRDKARAALAAQGVERIDQEGVPARPEEHEVVRTEASERPRGTIVTVDQAGYRMADRVLRPAKVAVAKPIEAGHKTSRAADKEGDAADA